MQCTYLVFGHSHSLVSKQYSMLWPAMLAGTITVGDKEVVTVFALDGLAAG